MKDNKLMNKVTSQAYSGPESLQAELAKNTSSDIPSEWPGAVNWVGIDDEKETVTFENMRNNLTKDKIKEDFNYFWLGSSKGLVLVESDRTLDVDLSKSLSVGPFEESSGQVQRTLRDSMRSFGSYGSLTNWKYIDGKDWELEEQEKVFRDEWISPFEESIGQDSMSRSFKFKEFRRKVSKALFGGSEDLRRTNRTEKRKKHGKSSYGLKVVLKGRLRGAAKRKKLVGSKGNLQSQTINKNIEYTKKGLHTKWGTIGLSIYKRNK